MTSRIPGTRGVLVGAAIIVALVSHASGDEPDVVTSQSKTHPLEWTLRYASSRSDYIRQHIRDYSCRLIKRERIDGKLQKHQFIAVKMRCEQLLDGEVVQPMAVFMHYLAPGSVKDRRVLYVEGQNDGKMLVRKGGLGLSYMKLRVDPTGTTAGRESNYPITDIGFDKILDRLTERVIDDIKNDPDAANTRVVHFRDARVGDRVCTHIQVIHPERGDGITFHEANLYIDDELQVPIRLTTHDWPENDGDESPLIEEYTYVDLKLNVDLTDADFSAAKLESPDDRAVQTTSSQ